MSNQKVELIDFLLKPFLQHVGFLNKCDRNPDGNAVVAAFDEIGLSTNIPQFLGLQTVRSFLLKYKETDLLILESTDFILKKKLLSLTMNTFYSSRVLQNTTFAPTYANLSTGYHEIKLNDLIEWKNSLDIRQYFAENWKKILDDCEILLIRDFIKPDDLLTILNS